MPLSTRLILRQGQSLVMTPQLLQAIKLLQLSSVELSAFVEEELERNPLLERVEERQDIGGELPTPESAAAFEESYGSETVNEAAGTDYDVDYEPAAGEPAEADWSREDLEIDASSIADKLGTELDNAFEAEPARTAEVRPDEPGLSSSAWNGTPGSSGDGEAANLEAYVAAEISLHGHLLEQLAIAVKDPVDRAIGAMLIDAVDEAGYLSESVEELALRLGASLRRVETVLALIQTFEPAGVAARNLAECLAIQLRERDRLDPAMQSLLDNLPLLARRDFATLRKLCGVDDEDIADMVREIRRLDPKPGRAYGGTPLHPVVPDVIIKAAADGSWHVELNADCLPRVLVNQTYATQVSKLKGSAADKNFVVNCLQTANWLTKSLEQRARTILRVASEIVRQQDAFFAYGVEHLRPLNLKAVADAIGMHESTVSRVTSNKYLTSPRGLFELKYFFTASISSYSGSEAHSAESVRFRIKQLIDRENPGDVLSDDAIVARLKQANVEIARRTVAKYRESLRIPSSVERRREKLAMQQTNV